MPKPKGCSTNTVVSDYLINKSLVIFLNTFFNTLVPFFVQVYDKNLIFEQHVKCYMGIQHLFLVLKSDHWFKSCCTLVIFQVDCLSPTLATPYIQKADASGSVEPSTSIYSAKIFHPVYLVLCLSEKCPGQFFLLVRENLHRLLIYKIAN